MNLGQPDLMQLNNFNYLYTSHVVIKDNKTNATKRQCWCVVICWFDHLLLLAI
jgi:hypothetical protein